MQIMRDPEWFDEHENESYDTAFSVSRSQPSNQWKIMEWHARRCSASALNGRIFYGRTGKNSVNPSAQWLGEPRIKLLLMLIVPLILFLIHFTFFFLYSRAVSLLLYAFLALSYLFRPVGFSCCALLILTLSLYIECY